MFQARALHEAAARSSGEMVVVKSKKDLAALHAAREQGKVCRCNCLLAYLPFEFAPHVQVVIGGLLGIEGLHCLEDDIDNVAKFFDAGTLLQLPIFFASHS